MRYTAIIKDGGLFIPNVFSELDDGSSHIVQVEVDIEEVREQLSADAAPKRQAQKRYTKKPSKKSTHNPNVESAPRSTMDEFEDVELSDMLKAYMSNEPDSAQISLENL